MRSIPLILGLLVTVQLACAQLVVTPVLKKNPPKQTTLRAGRTAGISTSMPLPFWDDFSFSNSPYYPHDTLWQDGTSVSLSTGSGINPPSVGTATFDGTDSIGRPYNASNLYAKGWADRLISRPIDLSNVASDQLDSIYLSFYYEYQSNGEAPDQGDVFSVDFLDSASSWENQFTFNPETTIRNDTFYIVVLPVKATKFLHDHFQFRFRNFGRLSGPYDSWNLDYVYMNTHRFAGDTSVPDRTITMPLTNLFGLYSAIPFKHFITDPSIASPPTLSVHNLEYLPNSAIDSADVQNVSYTTADSIVTYKSGAQSQVTHSLDLLKPFAVLQPLEFKNGLISAIPDLTSLDTLADSVVVYLKLRLNSGDNVPTNQPNGDYDLKYLPINFKLNDTVTLESHLSNYYAYDDGTAEYGIGLNQPGSSVAYLFEMKTPNPDTIVAVDIYFPRFGDESNQIIKLQVRRDLSDTPEALLYEENINVERTEENHFIRHDFNRNTVGVQGSFYIGWSQSSAATIAVGWDKNTDTGDKIYYNTGAGWVQNEFEHGSMMFHPVFGRGAIPTGVARTEDLTAFPNPSAGVFYLNAKPQSINIIDLAGKPIDFTSQESDGQTRIELAHPQPGIYVLKTIANNRPFSQKVLIRP